MERIKIRSQHAPRTAVAQAGFDRVKTKFLELRGEC
jgi:hypothetical protein